LIEQLYDFDDEPRSQIPDRTPPQDLAAERSVLGAMLLSKEAIGEVLDIISGIDFYEPRHEIIFSAIEDLNGHGMPADIITVAAEIEKRGQMGKIGSPVYLADLVSYVSIAANASYYAEIVRDKAVLRRLIDASIEIAQRGYSGQGEAKDIVDLAQQRIYQVSTGKNAQDYQALEDILNPTLDMIDAARAGKNRGISTGFPSLDRLTNGFAPGQMIIIAARPGVGKSMMAINIAAHAAIKEGLPTALFSLEMGKTEIVMRLLSSEASVNLSSMFAGKISDLEYRRLQDKTQAISAAPLYIDDSPGLTMNEIRTKARRLKQRANLQLVIIDYIQLMSSGKRVESRQVEVSEFSRQVKLLAKELQLPVVALAQLNRGSTTDNKDGGLKEPNLAQLRESGALEQDADTVVLLHQFTDHKKQVSADGTTAAVQEANGQPDRRGEGVFIVAKNRNGPTGRVNVIFQGHYSRFVESEFAPSDM
jgi:replicative DNA helicase